MLPRDPDTGTPGVNGPGGVHRAVVLAAGVGSRIRSHADGLPKPLTLLNGKPLIAYTIDALAGNGIEDVVVVTGYRESILRSALREGAATAVTFVSNPDYELGASASLAAARPSMEHDPFLLLMADHAFEPGLVRSLIAGASSEGATVAADFHQRPPHYEDEATKLAIEDDGGRHRVTAIGKEIPSWQALDAGAFYCTPDTWDAVDATPHGAELSAVFGRMAGEGLLFAADVSGQFWYDVDTPDDLVAAHALLGGRA